MCIKRYRSLSKLLALFLVLALPSQIFFPIVHGAYRWNYRINGRGSIYVLESNITIENINNYGIIAEYLKPEGVYAYGVVIMKDPDRKYPDIYVVLGTQDHWFHLGVLKNMSFNYRLFIDINQSRAVIVYGNCSMREYRIQGHPLIKTLYLSIFNITGRASDYPRVIISNKVLVLNTTLKVFSNDYCVPNLKEYVEREGLSYNITEIYYPGKITPHTTFMNSSIISYYNLYGLYMILLVILTVIIATIIVVIVIASTRGKRVQAYDYA